MSHLDHTYAVVLAGGGGTRLWPKSRNNTPKQFLKLVGSDTMIQFTVARISKLVPPERIIVVTNKLYKDEVAIQLPQIPAENILCEPEKKDTALAMLTGALFAQSKDSDAIVVNCASDHVVGNEAEFIHVMDAAVKTATNRKVLVTVGITPTRPATGFGYIKIGEHLETVSKGLSLFKVDSFSEKPNEATARAFISTNKYFWNANMYVWKSTVLQDAFAQHNPALFERTKHLTKLAAKEFHAALPAVYEGAESISIDYAISEKADNLVLLPGDFGWNDVGDWKVVYDLETKDLQGNVTIGESKNMHALAIHSQNNLIHTNGRLVALVDINDMIVIDTDEIIMVIPKSKSQDVKKLVERLKEEHAEEYL